MDRMQWQPATIVAIRQRRFKSGGPSAFVDAAATLLIASGVDRQHIRIERFGVTGDHPVV